MADALIESGGNVVTLSRARMSAGNHNDAAPVQLARGLPRSLLGRKVTTMIQFALSTTVRVAAAAVIAGSLAAGQAYGASSAFDGRWAVAVTPEGGECEGMYVLPVEVTRGTVTYVGRAAITAEGGIGPDGTVRVAFIIEGDRLDAKGTMSTARFGAGSWVSPTEDCRGTWIARRR